MVTANIAHMNGATMSTALVANNLPIPSAMGSLEAYIGAVHQIPVLTVEDEQRLAHRLREDNDIAAAQELILSHLRFVIHVARGYSGYGLQIGDLIQEGNIGLMKAVKRFDPTVGVRLAPGGNGWSAVSDRNLKENFAQVDGDDLLEKLAIAPENVAYVGDDLIDWPVMEKVGLSVAVADAHPLLIQRADYVTRIAGGRGAVREVCDLLLLAQGKLDEAKGQSI